MTYLYYSKQVKYSSDQACAYGFYSESDEKTCYIFCIKIFLIFISMINGEMNAIKIICSVILTFYHLNKNILKDVFARFSETALQFVLYAIKKRSSHVIFTCSHLSLVCLHYCINPCGDWYWLTDMRFSARFCVFAICNILMHHQEEHLLININNSITTVKICQIWWIKK